MLLIIRYMDYFLYYIYHSNLQINYIFDNILSIHHYLFFQFIYYLDILYNYGKNLYIYPNFYRYVHQIHTKDDFHIPYVKYVIKYVKNKNNLSIY
jgi:hypothetical protein